MRSPLFMIAFFIPLRNKAAFVERAVRTALDQTHPCEVYVSDQGSTDGSLEVVRSIQSDRLHILQCPLTDLKGMAGLNVHLNWMHEQVRPDFVILSSADDYSHPERAEKTLQAFLLHDPDMVMNRQDVESPEGEYLGTTDFPQESRFITIRECIEQFVNGSCGIAWKHSFFTKINLTGVSGCDVVLPPVACAMGGCYCLRDQLNTFVKHVSPDNTGLESVIKANGGAPQYTEIAYFQLARAFMHILEIVQELKPDDHETIIPVVEGLANRVSGWVKTREQMAMERITPIVFPL